ncbi:MAG: PIN domain-containing protein [Syntrophobacteraceae bacterium]
MRVYLDCCCLQRPFDDRSQPRIAVEAEAVLVVLAMCESGAVRLLSSDALRFEIDLIPGEARKDNALAVLKLASELIEITMTIEALALKLGAEGLKPLDSLHLASASVAKADYFCTCDDRLLRKAGGLTGLDTKVVSPVELVMELDR